MFVSCTEERFTKILTAPGTHLLFKHSSTCGVSTQAYTQIEQFMNTYHQPIYLLNVHTQAHVKSYIAEKLGIRHESPQLLLIKNGIVEVVLNHRYITEQTLHAIIVDPL